MSQLKVLQNFSPFAEARCSECPLEGGKVVLPGPPRPTDTWTICASSPDKGDTTKMLGGTGGHMLDKMLARCGLDRKGAHVTAAVLCRPKKKMTPAQWGKALSCCAPRLRAELDQSPKAVLTLGLEPLKTFTGKGKLLDWFGAPLPGLKAVTSTAKRLGWPGFEDIGVFPTFGHIDIMQNKALGDVMVNHIKRAHQFAHYQLQPWEWPEEVIPDYDDDGQVANHAQLEDSLWRLMSATRLGVDVETDGIDPMTAALLNVGVSSRTLAVSIDWPQATPLQKELCGRLMANNAGKVMQNGQYDLLSLEANRLPVKNFVFDTLAAASIVTPRIRKNLGFQCAVYFWGPRWKTTFRNTSDKVATNRFLAADPIERALYNARDTWMTLILAEQQQKCLDNIPRANDLMEETMAMIHIAAQMRTVGVEVDQEELASMRAKYTTRVDAAETRLKQIAADNDLPDFTPSKPKDLIALFRDQLGHIPTHKSEKTGAPSYAADALTGMQKDTDPKVREAAGALLDYRKNTKFLATYLTKVNINEKTGAVHPTWNPFGAKTGRWSSQEPNFQNQPPDIRVIYRARPGKWLVECDYSGLELRVLALVAGDTPLLEAFEQGKDVHALNAITFFGEMSHDFRQIAKKAVYSMNYGSGPQTMYAAISVEYPAISYSAVLTIIERWKKAHPAIYKFNCDNMEAARKTGRITEPLTGRTFNFHGDIEPTIVNNFPIQTATMGIMNPAMRKVAARNEVIVAQVHDSIYCETDDVRRTLGVMIEAMEAPVTLRGVTMKFPVDIKIGRCWGRMKKVKRFK